MKIQVCSKSSAMKFESDVPWACISISSHAGQWPVLNSNNLVKTLQLAFPDYELPRPGGINETQAQQIIDFINEIAPIAKSLLVHCEMGASRSPAVAAAVAKYLGQDNKLFFENYTPNMIVYKMVAKQAGI